MKHLPRDILNAINDLTASLPEEFERGSLAGVLILQRIEEAILTLRRDHSSRSSE